MFAEAYVYLQEEVWRLLKDVPPKVKGLLEQRFKQVAKKLAQEGKGGKDLTLSIGSNKGGPMRNTLAQTTANKNRPAGTASFGLNSSLGGSTGLKFKGAKAEEEPLKSSEIKKEQEDVEMKVSAPAKAPESNEPEIQGEPEIVDKMQKLKVDEEVKVQADE